MSWLRGHWQLVALSALVAALWQTPVVLPLKLLVVFFHEASHALAALLTGGSVEAISINARQGGVTLTRGGNLFALLSAGYLGSLAIGVAILLVALRTDLDRVLMGLLGFLALAIAAFYLRDGFALAFGIGTGLVLLGMAWALPHDAVDLVLRLIGLASMIYVPRDIFDDTIARAGGASDAAALARAFGGTAMLWGGLWLVLSLAVIAACLRWGLGARSNIGRGQVRSAR
ncbi:MAG TPA: M50 family peptidase [Aliiroseovarius sp.]|nr:M50 family peptidase [Aliiroseovarius sp.]